MNLHVLKHGFSYGVTHGKLPSSKSTGNNNPGVLRNVHFGPEQLSLDGASSGSRGLIQQHILITRGSIQDLEAKHRRNKEPLEEIHLGVDSGTDVFLFPVTT